ncbi:ectoine hydrolase [Gammaproteobacteria bacterium AB-CW1]|uniref:Ectoine hydrolase n=1 Tax=Natronospira elongata TaxID=3110268 RepID=A0AAP6JEM1_9GAMM|nr:ectoine hydrolase [Gammaproteobacteria bacterium AB-CW1]
MRDHNGLSFSIGEYERRLRELRERMARRRIDVAIITDPGNLLYLTGYQTTGYSYFQALVVPLEDEPFMVTRRLEETNVWPRTWVEITRPYSDTGDAIETLHHALVEFGLDDQWIGYERNSYFFPAYQQERMLASFDSSNFVDCYGIVEAGRITKSEEELAMMEKAARATEAGMAAGIAAAVPGATENDVAAAVHEAMFRAGGEYPAVAPYIVSGPRCMIGHATWEGRTIQENETVFLEVGGCVRRYHTAMMRTIWTGKPPRVMREAEAIGQEALAEMMHCIRPGVTSAEVDHAARHIISANRLGAELITRAGYSIGIAFPPSWDEGYMLSLKPGDRRPLEPGMTMHLIPWLWGVEGDKLLGISETVVVTETGCRSFFESPERKLFRPGPLAGSAMVQHRAG